MRVLGLLIATGGGVAIGFGWAGAAKRGCVDCQIPYLLSGGAAGLGLIVFGVGLLLLAQIRTESRRLGDRILHALLTRPGEGAQKARPTGEQPATPTPEPTEAPGEATPEMSTAPEPTEGEASPVTPEVPTAVPEPATSPLSAISVDAPASESEAGSDPATLAATTMAGGVVDADDDATSMPNPVEPAVTGERADDAAKRRGFLFRRKQGP